MLVLDYGKKTTTFLRRGKGEKKREARRQKNITIFTLFWGGGGGLKNGQEVVHPFWAQNDMFPKSFKTHTLKRFQEKLAVAIFGEKAMS